MLIPDRNMSMMTTWKISGNSVPDALFAFALSTMIWLGSAAHAVMFQSTANPTFNTTAPTGELAGSGWELQGDWGGFLATPIAPQYFLAARHVGGYVGQSFTFQGVSYATVAYWDDPYSDLRLWKVNGTFPTYAPLYTGSNELGRDMVVFGRGTQRGAEVSVTVVSTNNVTSTVDIRTLGLTAKQAKKLYPTATFKGNNMTTISAVVTTNTIVNGWQWGEADGAMRWGKQKAGNAYGNWLIGIFNPSGDPAACHLSGGDSSGAVFIHDGTGWKLAGINYAVEGPFQTDLNAPAFHAALVDKTGLYRDGAYFSPDGTAKPTAFYCSRVSASVGWIRSITGQ
jgi:hypothetical protein